MIKAIVFDMDGVLINAKEWHYDALNRALRLFGMEISRAEHLAAFDGLPTRRKLEILSTTEGLPSHLHSFLNNLKQEYTMEIVSVQCKPVFAHEYALSVLKRRGYKLAVASNSVRRSVHAMMDRAKLTPYFDEMLSNEDVTNGKPDPEIYRLVMARLGVAPGDTLILEDNEHGIKAARASDAHVMEIKTVQDVNLQNIEHVIANLDGKI